ncbi:aminopeptidase N, partial [Streptomyces sp. A7024]
PDPLARAVAWNAARDLVRDAELPPADYLDLAARHLPHESDLAIVQGVLTFARAQVTDRYLEPGGRSEALAALTGICRGFLAQPDAGAGLRLTAVRTLIDSATTPDELRDWLAAGTVPGGPVLDPELRWRALLRLSVLGAATPAKIDAELASDPSATGEEGAARCRAALPDPAAKQAAWEQLYANDELSNYLFAATAQGFWRPEQRDLVRAYVPRYFEAVVPLAERRGPAIAAQAGSHGFPSVLVEEDTLRHCAAALERDDLTPALRRKLADQQDDLRRALEVRAAH